MANDPARLALDIGDDILVLHLDHHPLGEHVAPMVHQRCVSAIIAAEFAEIVGEGLVGGEQGREAGKAGVDRITADVDNSRVRQCQMDEPGGDEVPRHLVGDPFRCRLPASDVGEIVCAQVEKPAGPVISETNPG